MLTLKQRKLLLNFIMGTLLFLSANYGLAQDLSDSLTSFNQQRIDLNTNGMYILSGWAISNIAVGTVGYFNKNGSTKYMHQMNVGWNIVNLAIAAGALYEYTQANPSSLSFAKSIAEVKSIENILLLNIGLNVGYMATGGFLWERGLRKSNERFIGYGQSLIIQGGFLLLFDTTLYLMNRANNENLQPIIESISIQGMQLSVLVPL